MNLRLLFVTVAALICALVPNTSWAQDHVHRPPGLRHRPRHPRPRPRPVSLANVQFEDQQGNALRTFRANGTTFVLGQQGRRYNLRLSNSTDGRIEVVVNVDGRDIIHGRRNSGTSDRGYLVPARGSVLIRGYRTSMSSVAAFRFSSPRDSFAGRHGQAQSVGIVNLAAYRERTETVLVPPPHHHHHRQPPRSRRRTDDDTAAGRSASPAPRQGEARKRSTRRPTVVRPGSERMREEGNLGTEFGEHLRSQIRQTTFVRANRHRPDQRLTLRYDDAGGLEARGIVVIERPPFRPEPVQFFEPRFAQPPPPRPHEPWEHSHLHQPRFR